MRPQGETAYLTAHMRADGCIAIVPYCADSDCSQASTTICAGETFGGRSFTEWQAVARGSGRIDAEWLNV